MTLAQQRNDNQFDCRAFADDDLLNVINNLICKSLDRLHGDKSFRG
jgi:hypothetical protein